MKPALQLRLGQQLKLTPQLRQAIRLLQLSQLELETELTMALESNPMLESTDERQEPEPPEASGEGDDRREQDSDRSDADAEVEAVAEPTLDMDTGWEDEFSPRSGSGSDDREPQEAAGSVTDSLHDHLMWQLNLTPMSDRDRAIGTALIDAIDDDGHLSEPLDAIRQALQPDIEADDDELEAVLHRIQRFDPIGVGARCLSECLGVQLSALDDDTDALPMAQRIAREHLEDLAKLGPEKLAKLMVADADEVAKAVELLRGLDPRPGAQVSAQTIEYVTPDAYVSRQDGVWRVHLAAGARPRLGINRLYEGLIGEASRDDANYLRGQLQEARWLIRSLETRADTVLRVATAIVRRQVGFLEHGPEAMRPLTLREIADELDLHESTISRVTTRKYLHTPRGTFEFKHFFSSSLSTEGGGSASSTAIQAMIKRLIDAENPAKPLSDSKLAATLKTDGITVARRTVAKYREAMNIPSSNERQRHG
ncbi:MAG: RNA polymerase factor sigma-54 [Lysobacteraceae bacterium]|nr:RNA polymerase factor sigma-54 [Rhodanobacteraceae bacterium]HPF74790.1 RNA polymerase factor sigma-54 [Xanthomonadaceae bacterium]HRY01226.1 RNA polymerase factor sigma-54 [Xanthomonadaceae bacterium]